MLIKQNNDFFERRKSATVKTNRLFSQNTDELFSYLNSPDALKKRIEGIETKFAPKSSELIMNNASVPIVSKNLSNIKQRANIDILALKLKSENF